MFYSKKSEENRAEAGDIIIIIAYAMMTPEEAKNFKPATVFPDENNRLI